MVQFSGNKLQFLFLSDSDNGLQVHSDMVDREVVEDGKRFSEWYLRATKKNNKARQSVMIDGLLLCTHSDQRGKTTIAVYQRGFSLIPSLFIFPYRVEGGTPSSVAAPPGPFI